MIFIFVKKFKFDFFSNFSGTLNQKIENLPLCIYLRVCECGCDQIKYKFFDTKTNWTILLTWIVIRMGNPDRQNFFLWLRFWIIVVYWNLDKSTLHIIMGPEWTFYDLSFYRLEIRINIDERGGKVHAS